MSSSCAPDPAAAVKTLQELSEFRGTSITKSAVFNAIELVNMFDADEVVTAG